MLKFYYVRRYTGSKFLLPKSDIFDVRIVCGIVGLRSIDPYTVGQGIKYPQYMITLYYDKKYLPKIYFLRLRKYDKFFKFIILSATLQSNQFKY